MRCFRLKCRHIVSKRVVNQRDYIGIENLLKHGKETYERYDRPDSSYQPRIPELYEKIEGRWKLLTKEEINTLFTI